MKRYKAFSILIFSLVIQLCMVVTAYAAVPDDLTGQTDYLVVHDTSDSYSSTGGPAQILVKTADNSEITPVGNAYSSIPNGSTINLIYGFHLEDGDGESEIYTYSDSNYFTFDLPEGISFQVPNASESQIYADVTTSSWLFGTWSFVDSDTIRIDFDANAASHTAMWANVSIEGTFNDIAYGDPTESQLILAAETYTFSREEPAHPDVPIAKSGVYNDNSNTIDWTVTVTPSDGLDLDGYTLNDVYSVNQTFVSGSFYQDTDNIADVNLDLTTANQVAYTFTGSTLGEQTITYRTSPNTFSNETGATDQEDSVFDNEATLFLGAQAVGGPVDASITIDWIEKSGSNETTADDSIIIRWEVALDVPGGQAITDAIITDAIPQGLELVEGNATYPIQFTRQGESAITVLPHASDAGTYSYTYNVESTSSLTYRLPTYDLEDGKLDSEATFVYYTELSDPDFLNNNAAITFTNGAQLNWLENPDSANPPADTSRMQIVGEGSLLNKSAGSTQNFTYPGYTNWTITINENKIDMENAKIQDVIPSGQQLIVDATHHFVVTQTGSPDVVIFSGSAILDLDNSSDFTSTDSFVQNFSYEFEDDNAIDSLPDAITSTYTVSYYTKVVDVNAGQNNDSEGLDLLYSNANLDFTNQVTLTRDSQADVVYGGTKTYRSQMIAKSIETVYNYLTHTIEWEVVVNRNRMPMTEAELVDTLPTGMEMLNNVTYPFEVYDDTGKIADISSYITVQDGDTSFTYDFGEAMISDQYTFRFFSLLTDDTLKTQWSGTQAFTNYAVLTADEITTSISASATAYITNPVITKEHNYITNTDSVDWSILINSSLIELNNAYVEDALDAGLLLDEDSLKLYEVDVDSSNGDLEPSSSGNLVTSGYSVVMPAVSNSNTLTVYLPESSRLAYRLEFTTFIITNDLNFTNQAVLNGSATSPEGNDFAPPIVINDLWSNAGGGSRSLTVYKDDGMGNPVQGSIYQLLNVNQDPILISGSPVIKTTDDYGNAVFTGLPEWTFYVKEVSAPDGYLLNPDVFGGVRLTSDITLSTSNDPALGTVSINVKNSIGMLISGGEFKLSGVTYDGAFVNKTATSVDGEVSFLDVPIGNYTIIQTTAPNGYYLTYETLTVDVIYADVERLAVEIQATLNVLINKPTPLVGNPQTGESDYQGFIF